MNVYFSAIAFYASFAALSDALGSRGLVNRGKHGKRKDNESTLRRALQTATSQQVCADEMASIESGNIASNGQPIVQCNCADNGGVNGSTWFCKSACRYCNNDFTVCGQESFGATIGPTGNPLSTSDVFTYSDGRAGMVFFQYLGCQGSLDDPTCSSCNVYVNETMCNSCSLQTCSGGISNGLQLPSFQCGNVEAGANYNLCSTNLAVPAGSVFEYLAPSNGFSSCTLGPVSSPTVSPQPTATPQPSSSPLPTFINNTQCPLRIGTSQCGPLLDTIEAVEGCDCYNFCGNSYSGCCGVNQNEPCSLACTGGGGLVAGCRLDGVIDDGPEEGGCQAAQDDGTELTFDEGEEFTGFKLSTCGSADDFPCFCAGLSETNSVRCPYCFFTQFDGSTTCARDGENITIVDQDGVNQRCFCEYLGNGAQKVECELVDHNPAPVCDLKRETQRCDALTASFNPPPEEECDCFNFCGSSYAGCCKYGDSCAVDCTGTDTAEITAGCEIDPTRPPVTAVPVPPTQVPVVAPRDCPLRAATDNCPRLIATQQPVVDCDCFNYCGDRFGNCCSFDDPECALNCGGMQPGEFITAGCQIDSSTTPPVEQCNRNRDSCVRPSDCCSNRCVMNVCLTSPTFKANKQKLSRGRGGAAGGNRRLNLRIRGRK
jgi:hypothetical protein